MAISSGSGFQPRNWMRSVGRANLNHTSTNRYTGSRVLNRRLGSIIVMQSQITFFCDPSDDTSMNELDIFCLLFFAMNLLWVVFCKPLASVFVKFHTKNQERLRSRSRSFLSLDQITFDATDVQKVFFWSGIINLAGLAILRFVIVPFFPAA